MDDKEFRFMHTVDRPTVEQLRREIERLGRIDITAWLDELLINCILFPA